MAVHEGAGLERFLDAICRHPWARFDFLQLESGLSEFKARRARQQGVEAGYIELMRIATKGQPHPPRRYSLTPSGAHHTGLPLPPINRRAETLLAAPHLDKVRGTLLSAPAIRDRLVWSISPRWAAPGLTLDALACMRREKGGTVLVAFAVPPESAASSWWYIDLLRDWFRLRRQRDDPGGVLVAVGLPFEPMAMPMLIRRRGKRQQTSVPAPVYFLPEDSEGSRLGCPEAWFRLPELGWGRFCPWDEPTLMPGPKPIDAYLGGKVPRGLRKQSIPQWVQKSKHRVAPVLRVALEMTHGESTLLGALLQYPAFAAEELALMLGLGRRSVLKALERMRKRGLVECLPLFGAERRSVLIDQGLNLLAGQAMQTPARFRARRAWSVGHEPLTRSPRHMEYILAFMFALRRSGRLMNWDLVQARYGYCVAVAPGDLTRPRYISIVPDSSGILVIEGREVPFWLEIDRGTRNGVRLTRQLEKYILARFGYAASDPIPMLLYVVAEGGETRARLVARRLVELATRYRLRRMPAILITTWELLTNGDLSAAPDPLKPVWRLPFRWREYIRPVPPRPIVRARTGRGVLRSEVTSVNPQLVPPGR